VDRVLERIALVRRIDDLVINGHYGAALGILGGYSVPELAQDAELGVPFAWSVHHSGIWERRELLAFAQKLRSSCEQHADSALLHRCRNLEAVLTHHLGDSAAAEQIWREEVVACAADGDVRGEMFAWSNLGMVADTQGRIEESLAFFQRALSLADQVGVLAASVTTYNNLGMVYLTAGRPREAEQAIMTALQRSSGLETEGEVRPFLLISLAQALTAQGDQRAARAVAMRVAGTGANSLLQAELDRLLGVISIREGQFEEAEARLSTALQGAREVGERLLVAQVLETEGELFEVRCQIREAVERYLAAEAVYLELPSEWRAARARARADALRQ
jgi:tetratricopeptide (TPR) repeat protein